MFTGFQSSAVRSKVAGSNVRGGRLDAVFGHINGAQTLVNHLLNFDQRVQNYKTGAGVLRTNIDVAQPVFIQTINMDSFDFFLSVHLVVSQPFSMFCMAATVSAQTHLHPCSPPGTIAAWLK